MWFIVQVTEHGFVQTFYTSKVSRGINAIINVFASQSKDHFSKLWKKSRGWVAYTPSMLNVQG